MMSTGSDNPARGPPAAEGLRTGCCGRHALDILAQALGRWGLPVPHGIPQVASTAPAKAGAGSMEARKESNPARRSGLWRWIVPLVIAAAGIGALVYFLAPYRADIRTAIDRASIGTLVEITALSLVALPLRTDRKSTRLNSSH